MKRRNPDHKLEETIDVDYEDTLDPKDYAPWYEQLLKLSPQKRKEIADKALLRIKEAKPQAYEFIKKFNCDLVGISPRLEYCLLDSREGELGVTWVHSFSAATLLYWCPDGGFPFMINANLDFNDTVLNKVSGNKKQNLRGFTS